MSYPRKYRGDAGKVLLEVQSLSAATGISDIDLIVPEGESSVSAGLVGSGRTKWGARYVGADETTAGQIIFNGQPTSGGLPIRPRGSGSR